jgi:hypothetical protein
MYKTSIRILSWDASTQSSDTSVIKVTNVQFKAQQFNHPHGPLPLALPKARTVPADTAEAVENVLQQRKNSICLPGETICSFAGDDDYSFKSSTFESMSTADDFVQAILQMFDCTA